MRLYSLPPQASTSEDEVIHRIKSFSVEDTTNYGTPYQSRRLTFRVTIGADLNSPHQLSSIDRIKWQFAQKRAMRVRHTKCLITGYREFKDGEEVKIVAELEEI
jgi:hypothetical protein